MPNKRSTAEQLTETYYDSSDADKFYELVWGGEDIHIGLYEPGLSISEASRLTVEAMANQLETLSKGSAVIDLGAGYGGSSRFLAQSKDCHVTCLNLSEVQNQRNRKLNLEQDLDEKITVMHGSFENIPCDDQSMDIVWSQDSFLHSDKKQTVISEIARVLKPGGELIFTDPMQSDDCPDGVLQAVFDRLNLESMGSFDFYRQELISHGFKEVKVMDFTPQLRTHYASVKQSIVSRYDELEKSISPQYMEKMILGLDHWVNAADSGYLAWGIQHYKKES